MKDKNIQKISAHGTIIIFHVQFLTGNLMEYLNLKLIVPHNLFMKLPTNKTRWFIIFQLNNYAISIL